LSLLKRTFEATGFYGCDFDDAARSALWLEARDLPGIATVLNESKVLCAENSLSPELSDSGTGFYRIDGAGLSLFDLAIGATDLAIAATSRFEYGHIEISTCSGRQAIIPSVHRCSTSGYAAAAWWFDARQQQLHVARADGSGIDPDYAVIGCEDPTQTDTVELHCASSLDKLLSITPGFVNFDAATGTSMVISGSELKARFRESLAQGIDIAPDDYRSLCGIADRVLVESNEQSRLGAGA
jgi:hypothetical protein